MQKFRYSKAMLKQSHFCTPSAQTKQHIKKYTDEIITYNWIYRGAGMVPNGTIYGRWYSFRPKDFDFLRSKKRNPQPTLINSGLSPR